MPDGTQGGSKFEVLSELMAEVLHFGSRLPSATIPDDAAQFAEVWAGLFVQLGATLQHQGYARQLMSVTIGTLTDRSALDILRMSCALSAASDSGIREHLIGKIRPLVECTSEDRERFLKSLDQLLKRLTLFHC